MSRARIIVVAALAIVLGAGAIAYAQGFGYYGYGILWARDEGGTPIAGISEMDCVGSGITCARDGTVTQRLTVTVSGSSFPVADTTSIVEGSADGTKEVRIEADGLTTGTTRVLTMPDRNYTLGQSGRLGGCSGTVSADTYFSPDAQLSGTEAGSDAWLAPTACTVRSFRACVTSDPAGGSWAFTVRTGAPGSLASTSVTCTIPGGDADLCCADTSNTGAIVAGEAVTVLMDETGTLTSGNVCFSMVCD